MEKISKIIQKVIHFLKLALNFLYQYRFWIAGISFLLCILFEISGSSIGVWAEFIQNGQPDNGLLFGMSRGIRSDEWAVLSPMTFSQQSNGFSMFSDIIRAGQTDVTMVYSLPVLGFIQLFRPFQIGYILLGISKGLSFFWCGRFIALFLVTFEMVMLLTKKNKLLSFVGAVLVTLAPMVQWWFAINGIAEILIFGQLAIILLYHYMNTTNFKKRCLYLFLMVICGGGYVLVLYPAWQVAMAYAFLALAIWVIVENRKNCKISRKDIISIGVAILVFGLSMAYVLMNSLDTIKAVMGTVYPGSRTEVGGGEIANYVKWVITIFYPFKESGLLMDTCESATMFGLFPMGLVVSGIVLVKQKKKDLLLILLFVVYAFMAIWCIWGFPEMIAKLTLMSNSQTRRTFLVVGFVEIMMLLRALAIMEKPLKRIPAISISFIVSVILIYLANLTNQDYVSLKMGICMGIMCVYLFYTLLRYKAKYANILFALGIIFVMTFTGFAVNPIRRGLDVVYENEIIQEVQKITQESKENWIIEGLGFPYGNYLIMAGAPTINCTNVYPNLDRWEKIDPEKQYQDIYNRYSHITIHLVTGEEVVEEKFKLLHADSYEVYLTVEELEKLDVSYIFTPNELEKFNTKTYEFKRLYENNGYKIYQIIGEEK